MSRFQNFINELSFKNSSDQDYPEGMENGVLMFNPTDSYIRQGDTHGIISHAIKHMKEFNSGYFNSIVNKIKGFLKNKRMYFYKEGGTIQSINNPTTFPDSVIANTMDRINDKVVQAKSLESDEKFIANELKQLGIHFEHVVEGLIVGAVEITNTMNKKEIENILAMKKTIKYIIFKGGADMIHYYNPREHALVIEFKGLVRTAFKINRKDWYATGGIKFYNPDLKQVMKEI